MSNKEEVELYLTDEQYDALTEIAAQNGMTVEELASQIIEAELTKIVNDPEYAIKVKQEIMKMAAP